MREHIGFPNITFRDGTKSQGQRQVAVEVPVAISYHGTTQAVLMASPNQFEDLAVGFTITEGIVDHPEEVIGCETIELESGYEVRVDIGEERLSRLLERRRFIAGPVGCGLCGIDSIDQAVRNPPRIQSRNLKISAADIALGMALMANDQRVNKVSKAVHAAAYYVPGNGLIAVREDVGRHNAFDKLIGHCMANHSSMTGLGAVFVSSRLSVEMVQKAAYFQTPILVAISAPTSLGLSVAEQVGLTVVAVARGEDFEVFTHPHRITF